MAGLLLGKVQARVMLGVPTGRHVGRHRGVGRAVRQSRRRQGARPERWDDDGEWRAPALARGSWPASTACCSAAPLLAFAGAVVALVLVRESDIDHEGAAHAGDTVAAGV
ncbi:hypothetical protein [Baekduia alba]|uniref:hypothetical protein n=1 Tax=Baekduia alba TaxID=2997333 RepID=UPI002341E0E0|nr:hypothetical protein [Baekduia alba]